VNVSIGNHSNAVEEDEDGYSWAPSAASVDRLDVREGIDDRSD
jgi:hypothetical protein